jgi:prepilin peptidase CpaA
VILIAVDASDASKDFQSKSLKMTLLIVILTIAVITDLLYHKIPNALTFPVIFYGLIYHIYLMGFDGFLFSAGGLLVGLALLLFLNIGGMMGAGDVKLMGAIGSILGPEGVFKAFLFTAVVGGIYALIVLAYHGQLLDFFKRMALSLKVSLLKRGPTLIPNENKETPILCYGIAIAIGTSLSVVF